MSSKSGGKHEFEHIVCDENRGGIELLELHGGAGYDGERLILENGLSNGLRFLAIDNDADDACFAHFHIHDPEIAKLLAARLTEFAGRIADPPDTEGKTIERHGKI